MKKLIITAAIVFGMFSSYAQVQTNSKPENVSQTNSGAVIAEITVASEEEFKVINNDLVTAPVHAALEVAHPGAVIECAHVNKAKEYKLDVAVENKKSTVYSDTEGNWIKK